MRMRALESPASRENHCTIQPMLKKLAPAACAVVASLASPAHAQYPAWQGTGSLFILTTPDGADLPDSAAVEGFPLLVRLNKDFFDFSKAKAGGEDLRFSAAGKPLAYQIEQWDPVNGLASIWVKIPRI